MPNPKRKHSHARSAKRRGTWRTEMPEISPNRTAGTPFPFVKPHHASPDGYYKGRRLPGFKDE
jgi:ribosomal protein L32